MQRQALAILASCFDIFSLQIFSTWFGILSGPGALFPGRDLMISATVLSVTLLPICMQEECRLLSLSGMSERSASIGSGKNHSERIFTFPALLSMYRSCTECRRLGRWGGSCGFLACFCDHADRCQSPLVEGVPLLFLVPC